jgi:hypothetical protein
MSLTFLKALLLLASDAGVAASVGEQGSGHDLPPAAFFDATGPWRPAGLLQAELEGTERVLANLGVANLRQPGVPDQFRCTLVSTVEAGRSVTLTGMPTTPLATGVVGTISTDFHFDGVVTTTKPRPVEKSVATSVRTQILEEGQCLKTPGDSTGVPPMPPREVVVFAETRFLLIEVVDSGHSAFCRIWATGGKRTLMPQLDAPVRKACAALFGAVGFDLKT